MCLGFNFSAAGQSSPPDQQPQESAIVRQQRSIAIQQQSVERQRAATGQLPTGTPSARPAFAADPGEPSQLPPAACAPVSPMVLESVVQSAAAAYRVAPNLINAVIRQESGGYPCAVSGKGAMGLMQLMPATAVSMGASEPFDVQQNVLAGTRLLADLMQRYQGDMNRVLGAYNAGTAAVDRSGGMPPFPETLDYVHSILDQIKPPFDPKLFGSSIR
jgi:soluble lytic murein transglycosylase-like protein